MTNDDTHSILASIPNFIVVQIGCAIFGSGDTRDEAIADARQWGATEISTYTGTQPTSDHVARKCMTDTGEMSSGEMVLLTREQYLAVCRDGAVYFLDHAGLITGAQMIALRAAGL
jgi:hypothetical protein